MKFNEMIYTRPDTDEVLQFTQKLINDFKSAQDASEQIRLIKEYSQFKKELSTNISLAKVRFTLNTQDPFYEAEMKFLDENTPIYTNAEVKVYKAIYDSIYKEDLIKEFGEHYFKLLECSLVLNDKAIAYMQRENELTTEYKKLIATANISFEGKDYTLTQMGIFLQDLDRNKRKAAYEAMTQFYETNQDTFDRIYDDLVHTRTDMAKALGYENYVQLGYKLMNRTDYSDKEISLYRKKILQTLTPLGIELRKKQQENLGLDQLKFYDMTVLFNDGNPNPIGSPEDIVRHALEMYKDLSKETEAFFTFMVENNLLDLLSRPGKTSGGYCTTFDKYEAPFIFANFNGTRGDIDVVTHEAGHAFQAFMSRKQLLPEYIWPTYEACEIHSMSMEFLTWPYMDKFFGENSWKFKYAALIDALFFIPYGATVDHFQHFVYENPNASMAERRAKYHELEMMYRPYLDYDNDFLNTGTFWYRQAHIFESPFYYIDYTLAQVCAFQYLVKSLKNPKETLADYITLCKAGGSDSFFNLIQIGKIKNPMTTSILEEIVPEMKALLEDLYQA